jgi:hypothetical protein
MKTNSSLSTMPMGCLICILVSTLFATEATDHMLIRDKARIDNIVFTCAILHNMLIENDKWEDEDDIDDVAADIPEHSMDERITTSMM